MAGEKALDGIDDLIAQDDSAIDEAVGDLRGVLKKDAGSEPGLTEESVDGMGGAAAFGSDFGADFEDDATADDPFNIGDSAADTSEFGAGLDTPGLDGSDFAGGADFGGDFGVPDLDGPAAAAQPAMRWSRISVRHLPPIPASRSAPAVRPTASTWFSAFP
jgi:hypothetical protein